MDDKIRKLLIAYIICDAIFGCIAMGYETMSSMPLWIGHPLVTEHRKEIIRTVKGNILRWD